MIDLAGSENSKDSGVVGVHMQECNMINKSLMALRKVFKAMKEKKLVPFKESTLTYFLNKYLSKKNSKALMIVNVSPQTSNYQETYNSLLFAKDVNQCILK